MAIGGIGLEIASLFIMYRGQKDNLNIRGAFWHVMNAFLGSIAVIIAVIFILAKAKVILETKHGFSLSTIQVKEASFE